MFAGHYGIALAAKRAAPRTSVGWMFLAVQLLDILWVPTILLGIEHVRIVPGLLPASSFDFYDMPWTHSLLLAAAWSWVAYRVSKIPVIGFCVFSHWVLDFVVHWKDLPLIRGGPRVGLGLWRWRDATMITEAVILILGLLIYMRATRATKPFGRWAMPLFVVVLIAVNAMNLYGPAPEKISVLDGVWAELFYIGSALVAGWLDRFRTPSTPPPQ